MPTRCAPRSKAWPAGSLPSAASRQGEIRTVRDLLDAGDQFIARGRFTAAEHSLWGDMNSALHQFLVDATANTLLKSFMQQTSQVPLASMRDHHWFEPDVQNFAIFQLAHRDHHEMFDAIIRRQSARAEARMREHVYLSLSLVRSRFRQQTVGFDAAMNSRPSPQKLTR
jgi:GntR family transcriptional regulator, vanillate catabolism transcriptional regulator